MAPTLRAVLALPRLDLRLVPRPDGTADDLDRPVRWVAVSELLDPTPYLSGGELLLTTGMRLSDRDWTAYAKRLAGAGVSAIGLGIGLTHDDVPAKLRDAAARAGLPVIEVGEPTSFIAVSQAVSELLAAEEYEAVSRAAAQQRELTRAALEPEGPAAVVARLAKSLGGEVLLLDARGGVLHAAPREATSWAVALEPELVGMRARGPRTAAAFSDAQRSVVVHPLAAAGRVRGFLAVGRADAFTAADHALISVAVALVALGLEQAGANDTALRDLRAAVFALLVGGTDPADLPVDGVGWAELLAGPVRVLVGDGSASDLARVHDDAEDHDPHDGWVGVTEHDHRVVILVPADGVADAVVLAADLADGRVIAWGISDAVPPARLADGLRQARRALAAAGPGGTRTFGDLARKGVVGLLDEDAARGFADALLGPLEARDRGDLVASVRAYLAHHGQWDAAATTLGVHRHTLRYRMRRAEELLGRSLDDPDLRSDLWVALAIRDRDAAAAN
jgi:PucR family transcriptional regulator, purine catabolism regulatory protein